MAASRAWLIRLGRGLQTRSGSRGATVIAGRRRGSTHRVGQARGRGGPRPDLSSHDPRLHRRGASDECGLPTDLCRGPFRGRPPRAAARTARASRSGPGDIAFFLPPHGRPRGCRCHRSALSPRPKAIPKRLPPARMEEQLAKRDATQPTKDRTAGSTFRNPAGFSSTGRTDDTHELKAWKVIDDAGIARGDAGRGADVAHAFQLPRQRRWRNRRRPRGDWARRCEKGFSSTAE